jgi:hypothetical protein
MMKTITCGIVLLACVSACYGLCDVQPCIFTEFYCSKNGNDGLQYVGDASSHTQIMELASDGTSYTPGEVQLTLKWNCDCTWGCAAGDANGYAGLINQFFGNTCTENIQTTQSFCVDS